MSHSNVTKNNVWAQMCVFLPEDLDCLENFQIRERLECFFARRSDRKYAGRHNICIASESYNESLSVKALCVVLQ